MSRKPSPPPVVAIAQTPSERERCFAIRLAVFVQEQHVPVCEEMDDLDREAVHFLAAIDGLPSGTARLLAYDDHGRKVAKIGRVAVLPEYRGRGIGLALMEAALSHARELGYNEALLDSQTHVVAFYERLGFAAEGEEFLEAGIPHYRMRRRL